MKYFIGVDQGGSKTEILIGDENGTLIDKCSGFGYCSFLREIKETEDFQTKYIEQLTTYLKELLHKNNLDFSDIYAMTACIATVGNTEKICEFTQTDTLEEALKKLKTDRT